MGLCKNNRIKTCILAGLFWLLCAIPVFAAPAGTVTITGGGDVQVGQDVGITVTVQGEASFSETDMFISYDEQQLQFVSGDAETVDDSGRARLRGQYPDGSTQQTWNLQFRAVSAGTSQITAEDVWIHSADPEAAGAEELDVTVNPVSVNVSETQGDEAAAAGTVPASQEPMDPLQALAEQIANDGTMSALVGTEKWMVQETFPDEILPKYFVASTQFYKGVEIKAAQLNNSDFYLVYVKSEDGTKEKFCEYNSVTKEFKDPTLLAIDPDHFLYLATPAEVPEYFTETVLTLWTIPFPAWQLSETKEDVCGADPSQFYILCGYNQTGMGGWYLYDTVQNSLMRYTEMGAVDRKEDSAVEGNGNLQKEYEDLLSKFNFLVKCVKYAAVVLIAFLLLLLIISLTERGGGKKKEKKKKHKETEEETTGKSKKSAYEPLKTAAEKEKHREKAEEKTVSKKEKPAEKAVSKKEKPAEKAGSKKEKPAAEAKEEPEKQPEEKPVSKFKKLLEPEEREETFVDDYNLSDDAPQTEEEKEAIGVLKPLKKDPEPVNTEESAKKDMRDSIEELSKQIQQAMEERDREPSGSPEDLGDLTFIDLDDE